MKKNTLDNEFINAQEVSRSGTGTRYSVCASVGLRLWWLWPMVSTVVKDGRREGEAAHALMRASACVYAPIGPLHHGLAARFVLLWW